MIVGDVQLVMYILNNFHSNAMILTKKDGVTLSSLVYRNELQGVSYPVLSATYTAGTGLRRHHLDSNTSSASIA